MLVSIVPNIEYNRDMKRTTVSEGDENFKIGWLAGIIDGEGSLAHYYCRRKGTTKEGKPYALSPIYGVVIVNTDIDILNEAQRIYGTLGVHTKINQKSATRKQREGSFEYTKNSYELVVRRRRDVETVLKLVEPYLVGYKKQKALDMLKHFDSRPYYSHTPRATTK